MNIKKISAVVLAVSISAALISGCSSAKTNASDSTTSSASATPDANSNRGNRRVDPAAMKEIYSTTLKALVADNTITQAQADKVLEALTKNMPANGQRQNGASGQNGQKPTGTPPANRQRPSGTPSANGRGPQNNRLSELVKSNEITQAQADTINQKINEALKNAQNSNSL